MSLGVTLTFIILTMYLTFITLRRSSLEDATNWHFFIALIAVTFDSSSTNLQLCLSFSP